MTLNLAITNKDGAANIIRTGRNKGVAITYVEKTNDKATTSGLYKCKTGNWD